MTLGDLVLAAQANGAVDAAMEDILAKVLTHLKLEADNITFEALFQRLVDIALASITIANILALSGTMTTLFLYILLLPINIFRLGQMLKLVKRARIAAQGDLSMDWLKPFMT